MTVSVAQVVDLILILYELKNLTFPQRIFNDFNSQTNSFSHCLKVLFPLAPNIVHGFP